MEIPECIGHVRREGQRLLAAANVAGLDAPVPSCPGWAVRDLVRHTAGVHHWAATEVGDRHTDEIEGDLEDIVGGWPSDYDLLNWAGEKLTVLIDTFEAADPDFPYFNWFRGDTPLTMWTRRQAHEMAIHRVDAELATGDVTPFEPAFAADGIDELVIDMVGARRKKIDVPRTLRLHLHATDIDRDWTIDIAPDGLSNRRGIDGEPDCTATASAATLYLAVWHRLDSLDVEGDPSVLDAWWGAVAPAWS